jgi:Fe2+ or Zn2+ uptake regulation protein
MTQNRRHTVAELDSPDTYSTLAKQAAMQGFRAERTVIEMSGRCGHCQGSA